MVERTFAAVVEYRLDGEQPYDLEDLAERAAAFSGAVGGTSERVSLAFDVRAVDAAAGVLAAQVTALELLAATGARPVETVELSVLVPDEQEARLARPLVPELVGLGEVAALLGVSKQRVNQLRERPDFPSPVASIAAGPIWTRPSLEHFLEGWSRRPGRPARQPAEMTPEQLVELAAAAGVSVDAAAAVLTAYLVGTAAVAGAKVEKEKVQAKSVVRQAEKETKKSAGGRPRKVAGAP